MAVDLARSLHNAALLNFKSGNAQRGRLLLDEALAIRRPLADQREIGFKEAYCESLVNSASFRLLEEDVDGWERDLRELEAVAAPLEDEHPRDPGGIRPVGRRRSRACFGGARCRPP
jgi:hypothetical protein